jgi:hypothetical protein
MGEIGKQRQLNEKKQYGVVKHFGFYMIKMDFGNSHLSIV